MKTVFTTNDFKALQTIVDQLKDNRRADVSENSYLQQALMDQLENLSQTEAEHIVNEIMAGIEEFYLEYNNQADKGQNATEDILRQAIVDNGMDVSAAMSYLAGIIIVMDMQKNNPSLINDEDINAQLHEILKEREVSTDSVEELLHEAVTKINQNAWLNLDAKMAEQIASTGLNAQTVQAIREMTENPLYVAIAAYIAGAKGELEMPQNYDNPRLLGVGVASGLKSIELTADLADGIIDENVWLQCMKIVIAVALAMALAYVAMNVMAAISIGLFFGGILIMGASTVAVIASSILSIGFLLWATSRLVPEIGKLVPIYDECFDKAVEWISTFVPQVAERLKNIYLAVRERLLSMGRRVKDMFTTPQSAQENLTAEAMQPAVVAASR